MFEEFQEIQYEHSRWLDRNFPDQEPYEPLLGLIEEVGELSHAHLKMKQGIRGTQEELRKKKEDAVGDIFIYLVSYCCANELSLRLCIEDTLDQVWARNWVDNPHDGEVT
jgi:NTP pyrophosphatase (non-canonical NTP hydrolase)